MQNALQLFARDLTVTRVGITYAIEIGFESRYPELAATIANAVADQYIELHRKAGNEAASRASDWLEARIPELRAKSEAAQRAVVQYKSEHNIVETGGQLINDQRLADLTAKLNAARDETFRAKSRLDQLVATDVTIVFSTLEGKGKENDSLNSLRNQYFALISKEAELSPRYGPNNPIIISLRNQKSQLRSEIFDEFKRLKDVSKEEYTVAQLRETALKKEFDATVAQSQETNQAQVKLRELEASARAYQDLYNNFLTRYNASLQQASSPIPEASIISRATQDTQKDYAKTFKRAALFPVGGLALGLGIAFLREMLAGRVFRTSKSVQSRLGIACIGVLPKVKDARRGRRMERSRDVVAPRTIVRGDRSISWSAVDYPFSRFSEGVRSIKLAIDLDNRSRANKVIGFTSAVPNEGKSAVALAVGQLMARNGLSVIVVDCDLRNPALTRSVAPGASRGVVELVNREEFARERCLEGSVGRARVPSGDPAPGASRSAIHSLQR